MKLPSDGWLTMGMIACVGVVGVCCITLAGVEGFIRGDWAHATFNLVLGIYLLEGL